MIVGDASGGDEEDGRADNRSVCKVANGETTFHFSYRTPDSFVGDTIHFRQRTQTFPACVCKNGSFVLCRKPSGSRPSRAVK